MDRSLSLCLENHAYAVTCFAYSSCIKEMIAILVFHDVIDPAELIGAVKESLPILDLRLAPLYLCKRREAWEEHVVEVVSSCDILCPEVCLYSEDVCLLLFCHAFCSRLIGVAFLHWKVSSDCKWLVLLVKRLIVVKVEECIRSHDGVVTHADCLQAAGYASP